MTLVLIVVLLTLLAAIFLLRVSHGHAEEIASVDDLAGKTSAIDIEAFQNLINPEETEFLRSRLPAADFRRVQRERTLATLEYVQRIAQNSAVLLRLGQASRNHADPEVAKAARFMVERALTVRMHAMRAIIQLRLKTFLPFMWFDPAEVFDRYQKLTDVAVIFTRLQRPAFAGRVNAML
ncbi:MAG TPA: hypothetical protein VN577_14115 [Terriglobales bacterium]|nr:hypothetical protein [Terriglobales bacterium]